MEPGALGITVRLASSVAAPLVRKLFAQPGRGAGLVDRPVRISGLVAWRGEHRSLSEKDVRKLVAELVRRAADVPTGEDTALVDALTTTLLALGRIEMDDVQAVRLGHRAFARLLRQHVPADVDRDLSADGSARYVALLELSCLHVLHFFTQRSTFVARTLVEQSRQLGDVVEKLDLLLERLPHPSVKDAAFERRYHQYVARKHGTLTIFGLDLRSQAQWPLDSAYLSLEAAPAEEWREPPGMPQAGPGPQRADRALAGRRRVLLRGVAGSGKTTLVQWLAVSAARQDVTTCLPHLLGKVPFVLPLRTVVRRGELPDPAGFLRSTGNPLDGAQPEGWADRVLAAGRGLLLVDGIDEIPERERERTRAWLRDLLIAYPDNLWLVTSRPAAVGDGWLAGEDFTELTLSPMTRAEVTTFVERWHNAARSTAADEEERARLDDFQGRLLETLHRKQDLSRLATNPLMCGLICALHRERRAHLPRGRKELYDAALSMLLARRDVERDIGNPDGIWVSEEAQVQLLQRLAYWLIRNGQAELEHDLAVELIADALPSMPAVAEQGDAAAVLRHLLVRSGMLLRPTPDSVVFVHRTFQDFLGGKAAVEARDFDLMARNAHDDQWEDVIRMAVAHARPDERARLLKKIVTRGDKVKSHRTRLHLLAMACLEHATELDPAVRRAVEERAAALIPPGSTEEAGALAAAGSVVLELLPGPDGLSDEQAWATVVAASTIRSDAAVPVLARFRSHPALLVRSQLAWAWHRYDTGLYGREVIAGLDPEGLYFVAKSAEELRVLHGLGPRPLMRVHGSFPDEVLRENLHVEQLTGLYLYDNGALRAFDWLGAATRLGELGLIRCTAAESLAPVVPTGLTRLHLHDNHPRVLTALPAFTSLTTLWIGQPLPGGDLLAALPRDAPLRELLFGNGALMRTGLRGITHWATLECLAVAPEAGEPTPADWAELTDLPKLTTLSVDPVALRTAEEPLPTVRTVRLYGSEADAADHLDHVRRILPDAAVEF
ncbi:NACHT domain-containing protein [Streptomyces capparidis]